MKNLKKKKPAPIINKKNKKNAFTKKKPKVLKLIKLKHKSSLWPKTNAPKYKNLIRFPRYSYLKASTFGTITEMELKAIKKLLVKNIKKSFVFHVAPYFFLSKKAKGIRMGRGKGKSSSAHCQVVPGQLIISLHYASNSHGREILRLVASKLNIKTNMVLPRAYLHR